MKKYILLLLAIGGFASCADTLDVPPIDKITEETALVTYDNFKTFAWGLYDNFSGFPTDGNYTPSNISREYISDNIINANSGNESAYAYQKKIIPATDTRWSFTQVRKANLILKHLDNSQMSQVEKDHWRSIAYFFRSYLYYNLVTNFGDVPWVDKVMTDEDPDMFAPRTPREEVTQNMLNDLLWAEEHINPDGDGKNTINVHVVRALISRFGLFEGTWRKYHNLPGGDVYLKASIEASEKLLENFPKIMNNYDDLYNSTDLVGKDGIILCKQYALSMTTHSIGRVIRSSSWYVDLTKDAIDSYLCKDGKPIATSSMYDGDKDIYDQFRNRDRRLYYTVVPPFKVKITGSNVGTSFTWDYDSDPKHREYIDLMEQISASDAKRLPTTNFIGYTVNMSPHFRKYPNGQGFVCTELGYYFWKYYNRHQNNQALRADTENFPIFTIEEVMLNYAEAMWETGKFDQGIADITINKLRVRADVANMMVSEINASFDPNRDQTVDPVLWEIRRERRIELMGDGYRFNDLKRWKKGHYVNKQPLGAWVKNSDFNDKLKILGGGNEGYVYLFDKPKGWLEEYYLEPIPSQQIALNPNLIQNPGWK